MSRSSLSALLTVAALAATSGCAGSPNPRPGLLPESMPLPAVPEGRYRIQPGDELEIRFFHTPELDVVMPVRPDGFISVLLANELRAAGRTVEELRQELTERYREELADPELAVIVRTLGTYQVHVGGEVEEPGIVLLDGARNVLEAVIAAGGFLPSADPAEVFVVRRAPEGYELLSADLAAVLSGRSGRGNLALTPYDVVYVPSSPIAEVNKWVDQYLRRSIPISFSYRLDD